MSGEMNREMNWEMHRKMKSARCAGREHQGGLALVLVLVLLLITALASVFFYNSMVGSTRLSGANRDNTASLQLAESALELLRGGFSNQLNSDVNDETIHAADCTKSHVVGETSTLYSLDNCEVYEVIRDLDSSTHITDTIAPLDYIFFVSDAGAGLTETRPTLLQKVANGEAEGIADNGARVPSTQVVAESENELSLNDLFSNEHKPLIWSMNANGLLTPNNSASWTGATAQEKAAAWLELTRNPDDDTAMDIWVQAVGQTGFSRSYLQRYVGTFYPPTTVGGLSALVEASNVDRGITP